MSVMGETGTRVRWTRTEKVLILQEAIRLRLAHPSAWPKKLDLVRQAQLVLTKDRQKDHIGTVNVDSYDWFREVIDSAVEEAKQLPEDPQPQEPPIDIPLPPPPEPVVAPLPLEGLQAQLALLVEKLGSLDLDGLNATVEIVRNCNNQVTYVRDRITELDRRFTRFTDSVLGTPGTGFRATVVLEPFGSATAPSPVKEGPRPAASNGQPGPPQPARKIKVLVLGVDSGSTKHGIQLGTKDHAEISYGDTEPTKYPPHSNFDYIVAFKRASQTWVDGARTAYPRNRFHTPPGGAMEVAEYIRKLPVPG